MMAKSTEQERRAFIEAASKLRPPLTAIEVIVGRRQINGTRIMDLTEDQKQILVEMTPP